MHLPRPDCSSARPAGTSPRTKVGPVAAVFQHDIYPPLRRLYSRRLRYYAYCIEWRLWVRRNQRPGSRTKVLHLGPSRPWTNSEISSEGAQFPEPWRPDPGANYENPGKKDIAKESKLSWVPPVAMERASRSATTLARASAGKVPVSAQWTWLRLNPALFYLKYWCPTACCGLVA